MSETEASKYVLSASLIMIRALLILYKTLHVVFYEFFQLKPFSPSLCTSVVPHPRLSIIFGEGLIDNILV